MSDLVFPRSAPAAPASGRPDLDGSLHGATIPMFVLLLASGLGYAIYGLLSDMHSVREEPLALGVFILLGVALLTALGFEFVNGFHDTANAVATVIYTHSLPPMVAVIWSGVFNFLGVVLSSGAVAYSIVTLLPVELILQVGSAVGYAMIFALLIAAITWNLGTWMLGLPNSSAHALIGSVIGVGLANQLMAPHTQATSGVDWPQAINVLKALLFSPACGFVLAALLLFAMKLVVHNRLLYQAPDRIHPPPWWIRGLLILTCTGVSFAHGGNDGQKGMGLIMLVLIGAVPTAFALNRTMPEAATPHFLETARQAQAVFQAHAGGAVAPRPSQARQLLGEALRTKDLNQPEVFAALASLSGHIADEVQAFGAVRRVPAAATPNLRNSMYLAGEVVRLLPASGASLNLNEHKALAAYHSSIDAGTRYIPNWVKVSVAIALGLGTMVGWKRIVITVGERIGKQNLTYAEGASAELVAACTIGLAEVYGLPVSTTHILSSGVAGAMAANGSGLQWTTVRNMAVAWLLTLPATIALAGILYFILRQVI